MTKLSVVVITYNEEKKIQRCLEAVKWAAEIILVDSYSTDGTVALARSYTDRIYLRAWEGFARQRNFGMQQTSQPWILFVDADEYVTEPLQQQIRTVLQEDTPYHAFKVHRLEHFLGRPIRYGTFNPSYQPRLLRRGQGHWVGGSHAYLEVPEARMGILSASLYHDCHNTLDEFITRINRYSTTDARARYAQGVRPGKARIIFSPWGMWWKCYLVKKGYRDGFHGFLLSAGMGIYSFLRLVKTWHLSWQAEQQANRPLVEGTEDRKNSASIPHLEVKS